MLQETVYRAVTGKGSHGDAGPGEAARFIRHLASLTGTKIADGLIDPKLVLAWVMSALGAPGYLLGALVPVREAGALLPQIFLAKAIQARRLRKGFWVAGSAFQGLAALGIALAALLLEGAAAGWAILGCLAVLSLARASCSASYKDILARTLPKGTRGTVSGTAGSVAAVAVLAFAVMLGFGIIPREVPSIALAIALAGLLWLMAAMIFAGLDEPRETPAKTAFDTVAEVMRPLREDAEFRGYVLVRGLLIATALAPPFLVMLASDPATGQFGNLGLLLVASSVAAIVSSYVWGRVSDRSSRTTLMLAGLLAALSLGAAALIGFLDGGLNATWQAPLFVFVAQIAYEGVRAGRKTHLTDMDSDGQKPAYTALSNTMIGVLLLMGGGFGLLADHAGAEVVLGIFAGLSALAALAALGLSEVQRGQD